MKKIDITEINYSLKFEGYYWYSNMKSPEIVSGSIISKEVFTRLPFILEGQLYCSSNELSIKINHIDGKYHIYQSCLKGIPTERCSSSEYVAHDLPSIDKIRMFQYWEETEPDEQLAGMTTLIPAWQAFTGFIKH